MDQTISLIYFVFGSFTSTCIVAVNVIICVLHIRTCIFVCGYILVLYVCMPINKSMHARIVVVERFSSRRLSIEISQVSDQMCFQVDHLNNIFDK